MATTVFKFGDWGLGIGDWGLGTREMRETRETRGQGDKQNS
ncbi:hypothetical protein [Nostoc sp.]